MPQVSVMYGNVCIGVDVGVSTQPEIVDGSISQATALCPGTSGGGGGMEEVSETPSVTRSLPLQVDGYNLVPPALLCLNAGAFGAMPFPHLQLKLLAYGAFGAHVPGGGPPPPIGRGRRTLLRIGTKDRH